MVYLPRTIDRELDALLPLAPAIALDGAKGVGKSETALRRASAAWLLDDADQRALVQADPHFKDAPPGLLVIDEWQRCPEVWDSVRRQVDRGAPPGRFLLTGSATPDPTVDTHSGAGRILSLRLRPMALHERGRTAPTVSLAALLSGSAPPLAGQTDWTAGDYFAAIEASGLPGVMNQPARLRRAQLDAYLRRIVDRDLKDRGVTLRRPETMRRWLAAYAAASSTTTTYARIVDLTTAGDGGRPAQTTAIAYRDHLAQLWLLDPVPGWSHSRKPLARLLQAPKHQLLDPALSLRLMHLSAALLASPTGAHMAGPLFESLATLSVQVAAQATEATVGHLRTHNGDHEVDLVVEGSDGQVVGLEVKLAASVSDADVRHLHWLRRQLPDDTADLVVLTTGVQAYRRADGVGVVPLALFGP